MTDTRPSQAMSNQEKQDFPVDAILVGGESMDGGNSLQFQIKHAPLDALWSRQMDWGTYKTSVFGQMVYDAQALARIEARQIAQQSLLEQAVNALSQGVPLVVDYDEIEKRIAANMPVYVPQAREEEHKEEGN